MSSQGAGAEPTRNTQGEDQPDGNGPEAAASGSARGKPGHPSLSPESRTGSLPQRLRQGFRWPSRPVLLDPKFSRNARRYLFQAGLATAAMLAVLLFVDSLSQAALAAGLGSSVVVLFLNPSNPTAALRSLIGGHSFALVLGSVFSVLLFAAPVETFLEDLSPVRDLILALSVGLLILIMAVTDTEHPPAAGTVLGLATDRWEWQTVAIIISAVLLLAVLKRVLRSHLRDLM